MGHSDTVPWDGQAAISAGCVVSPAVELFAKDITFSRQPSSIRSSNISIDNRPDVPSENTHVKLEVELNSTMVF